MMKYLAFAVVFAIAATAHADGLVTVAQLHKVCSGSTNGDVAICTSFLAGVVGTVTGAAVQWGENGHEAKICIPEPGVKVGDVKDVFLSFVTRKHMLTHAKARELDAAATTLVAMYEAWPCPVN